MNVEIALDKWGRAIQALAPSTNTNIAIGAASANAAYPAGSELIRLSASCNCFIKFTNGAGAATSADIAFNAGAEVFKVPTGTTHVNVIQNGAVTGTLSVTKMV